MHLDHLEPLDHLDNLEILDHLEPLAPKIYLFSKKVLEKFGFSIKSYYLCSRETGYVERETHRFLHNTG